MPSTAGTPSLHPTAGRRAAHPKPQAGRRAAPPRPQAGRRRYIRARCRQRGDAVVTFKAETALLPHAIVRLMRKIKKNLCGCVTFREKVEKYR